MKTILTLTDTDINAKAPAVDHAGYKVREAARAIVLDDDGRVALLWMELYQGHKLPGGGIDPGESIKQALERELLEEIGCRAEIVSELGNVVEYRDEYRLRQTSYCFLAKKIGEQSESSFTEDELADGFRMVWVESIDVAIHRLEQEGSDAYVGEFMRLRDLALLKAAKAIH